MAESNEVQAAVRSRSVKLKAPESVFNGWAYAVGRHHFAAFGVAMREFQVDGRKEMIWSIMEPRVYAFEVGDMFYRAAALGRQYLQVTALWQGGLLEVHQGEWHSAERSAHLVSAADFADWLERGVVPPGAQVVLKGMSKAGVLAYRLPQ